MKSFAEVIPNYIEQLRALHRTPATCKNLSQSLRPFASFCESQGLIGPSQLEPRHFSAYIKHINGQGLAVTTVYSRLRMIRTWSRWLTLQGLVLLDFTRDFDQRHPQLLPRGSPTESQVQALLDAPDLATVPGRRDRAVLELLYGTGLRLAECCGLNLDHLNLEICQLHVHNGKGGRQRIVPFGPQLAQCLKSYLGDVRPLLEKDPSSALWLGRSGQRLSTVALEQRMRELRKVAGVPGISAHSLRHAYATHLLTHGAPVTAVQRLLGHATLTVTARYLNLIPLEVQQAVLDTHPRGKRRPRKR